MWSPDVTSTVKFAKVGLTQVNNGLAKNVRLELDVLENPQVSIVTTLGEKGDTGKVTCGASS